MEKAQCFSPIDLSLVAERDYTTASELQQILNDAKSAQIAWAKLSLKERSSFVAEFVKHISNLNPVIVPELAKQMGRPVRYGGELEPLVERAEYLIKIAPDALQDYTPVLENAQFKRYIKRVPLGIVLVIAPWNYPFITALNSIVPALLSGNVIILKHSLQTLLVGERLAEAFKLANFPKGVFTNLLLTHEQSEKLLQSGAINHLAFTGSVAGGQAMERATAGTFTTKNLELGGKDAAIVLKDADIDKTVVELASGAFFNSGQCCCGIERVYVAAEIFDKFVERFKQEAEALKLGNPLDENITLGPMAHSRFAKTVLDQVAAAIKMGAKQIVNINSSGHKDEGAYVNPRVLINVNHKMEVMNEETFGPVVGIMPFKNEAEAIGLANDSKYGLTASVWTKDLELATLIGDQLEVGIVFMNRCDYVDPALVWTGIKNTGYGAAMSKFGFDTLTRPKSYHLRKKL